MPSAAFLAWQSAPFAPRVVLCHVTLRQTVNGWTNAGSGLYGIVWPVWTHPSVVRADQGLYRELVGVKENVTDLTAVANATVVAATPGSWSYDASAGVLYVQRLGSGSPDADGTRMQAVFRIRLATDAPVAWGRQFADQLPYYPLLDGSGLPEFRQEQTHPLAPVSSYPSGRVTFNNAGGVFDYLAVAYEWTENDVEFRVGGGACGYSDYEVIVRAQVSRAPAAKNDVCEVLLRAASNVTNTVFPRHTYDQYIGNAAAHGKYAPMLWGTVFDVPLHYLQPGSFGSYERYVVIDPLEVFPFGAITVSELRAYTRTTGALAGTVATGNYSIVPAYCFLEVDDSVWPKATYTFRADVTRLDLASTKASIARDLLTRGCGIPTSQIDNTAFTQADLDDPDPVGLYVAGNDTETATTTTESADFLSIATSVQQLLDRLAPFFQVYRTPAGIWTCKVWDPGVPDLATIDRVTAADLLSFEPIVRDGDADGIPLQSSVTVHYRRGQVSGLSSSVSISSLATAALIGRENSGAPFESPYATDAANNALASRLLALAGVVAQEYHAVVGARLMLKSIGDKVRVTRTRGPSRAATFDQVLEIQSITKRLADLTCDVVLGNQRGLGETVKAYAPDGTPDFLSATLDQQRQYLFYVADGTPGPIATGVFW